MGHGHQAGNENPVFDRGAKAARAHLPDLRMPNGGLITEAFYICPLCISVSTDGTQLFRRFREAPSSAAPSLFAEHAPPERFGGRELLLTCADCDHMGRPRTALLSNGSLKPPPE